ncbi:hypothetical protein BJ684DRAFT_15381 [Piptocephalis cylindrospora]|uniref:Uncharacterized protein n=1 Tax=Piptocephalis cylindrospora TaxID=1907219 RepID=A0A4P9Y5Q0_9FUNG|nr:hypothetical protein BJ684DRAFT_15381 [Piptocephalis cylindrospora]|eukprot:RKP14283.1 hypothetical protein BJ684DRAFT_15381 [Piptocephalis cylindrospora]
MSQEHQSIASRRRANLGKNMRVAAPSPLSPISASPKTAPGGGQFIPLSPLVTSTPTRLSAHGPPPASPRIINLVGCGGGFGRDRRPSMPHARRASLTAASLAPRPRRGSVTVASVTPSGDVIIRERRESIKASMPTREVCRRKAARKHRRHRAIDIPKSGETKEGADQDDILVTALKSPTLNRPPVLSLGGAHRFRDTPSSGPGGYFKPLPSPRVNASFTFGASKTPSMERYIRKPSATHIGVTERRDLRTPVKDYRSNDRNTGYILPYKKAPRELEWGRCSHHPFLFKGLRTRPGSTMANCKQNAGLI